MKCNNFMCYRHNICKITQRDWLKKFMRNCEARKRYNRIIDTKYCGITRARILTASFDEERNKYHGRK